MLDKRLELGGLQVGGPRTTQNKARFRVANNVYQTRDNYFIPRSGSANELDFGVTGETRNVFRYNNLPFVLAYNGGYKAYYNSGTQIPGPSLPVDSGSLGVQAVEKVGNLYLNFPFYGLYKYDGYNIYRAGTPLPYYEIASTYLTTPTFYTRIIQSHMDNQGNVVHSGYYDSRTRLVTGKITVRTDKGAAPPTDQKRPSIEKASDFNGYNAFFVSAPTHSLVGNTVVLNTAGDHYVKVGIRLIYTTNAFQRYLVSGVPVNALSYEVLSFTATTVTVGNLRYLDDNGDWQAWDYVFPGNYYPGNPGRLSFYFMSVWTSDVATGVYYLQSIIPSMYESSVNHTFDVNIASVTASPFGTATALNLGPVLSENYDVLSVKQIFPVTSLYRPLSFTTFQDLAYISYSNEIYYSDTSEGGSFEMTEGASFALIGEGDDGTVQAICGNSDFLAVSRQYRNYLVTGNIPTGNYRVTEIEETTLGAYSNESMAAVLGKIFLFNKQGVWAISQGGSALEISENIRGLFESFSGLTSFPEESFFNVDSFPTFASPFVAKQFVRARIDEVRGFLCFVIQNPSTGYGDVLVLNLNNGEFYTWTDFNYSQAAANFQDLAFINGVYYHTQNGTAVSKVRKEVKGSYTYASSVPNPPQLVTTWFTAGEPSLEKKLNQVKLWGLFNGTTVDITHYLNWNGSTAIVDGTYTPAVTGLYSHKKRLIPANFQSVSVSVKFTAFTALATQGMLLEGMEIEFQGLQSDMKR